jgi:heat shock protein HslJ
MQRKLLGSMCAAIGFAIALSGSPAKVGAQQLDKVPKSAPLTGTKWMLAESAGQRVAQDGLQPYFELRALERFENGSAGELKDATDSCGNQLTGKYREVRDHLDVRIVSSTLLACKVSARTPKEDLGTVLAGNPRFKIRGSELDLFESNGMVRARFIASRE